MSNSDEKLNPLTTVKWSGSEYPVHGPCKTLGDLKLLIATLTGVLPDRQRLLGLKQKDGKPANDESLLDDLKMPPKLLMMGSREEAIATASTKPTDVQEVINDFDIPDQSELPYANREEYQAKIEKRVQDPRVIKQLCEPRPSKKLLVLDIDYTLFDHRTTAESPLQLMRPYLHEFLTSAYDDYDIAIWSATSFKWIEVKMNQLGVLNNQNYKVTLMLDSSAMVSVHTTEYGSLDAKPLAVIWGKYPDFYNSTNTIMFDDLRRNFLFNPQNGLRIRAFRDAHKNRATDMELFHLTKYLRAISHLPDLSNLNHKKWEKYLQQLQR